MPKINREEYEVLKGLDDKWKWIARDENGEVWVYKSKPSKLEKEWDSGVLTSFNNNTLLQFIQWEDKEPYNIAELIEEYESEETEVRKDKQWAINELTKSMNFFKAAAKNGFSIEYFYGKELGTREAIQILKKLDETEIVPKQDLPVIPKFVAEAIEKGKERGYDVYDSIDLIIETNGGGLPSVSDWVARNIDKYARAWLDGFTVEEEQKFYVLNENKQLMLKKHEGEVKSAYNSLRGVGEKYLTFYQLTEQEIKDYDLRYWAFRKPVEELEE